MGTAEGDSKSLLASLTSEFVEKAQKAWGEKLEDELKATLPGNMDLLSDCLRNPPRSETWIIRDAANQINAQRLENRLPAVACCSDTPYFRALD